MPERYVTAEVALSRAIENAYADPLTANWVKISEQLMMLGKKALLDGRLKVLRFEDDPELFKPAEPKEE